MPLDEHIESRHSGREASVEIGPDPVHDFLEVAYDGQHREYGLYQHAILPLPPLTQFEIGRIALGSMEAGITQNNHTLLKLPNQPLKRVICDIGRVTRPRHHQPPTGSTADRVCPRQSSDGWTGLCDRSAAGCGPRAWGGS